MKKSIVKLLFGAWTVLAAGLFAACVDDNDDSGMPFIEVNPETLVCALDGNFEGGGNSFEVKSNRAWTLIAETGSEWIEFAPKQGNEGTTKVELLVPSSNEGRVGTLTFQLANAYGVYMTQSVAVQQGEAPVAGPIASLVAYIKEELASASGTVDLNYSESTVEGVILANNQYGNNNGKLYVGDNVTAPNSAIVLYDLGAYSKDNSANYPVGKKVTLNLSNAKYAPYGNLRELKDVLVTVSEEEAVEVVVPTLTAAQFNTGNYQGQYVKVTGVTPQAEFVGQAWAAVADKGRTVKLDANGVELQCFMTTANYAPDFADLIIADLTGAIWGTAEQNYNNIQIIPTKPEDVLELTAGGDQPAVMTGAATAVTDESVTLSGSSRNLDNAAEVGIAYKVNDATEVAPTEVPAAAVDDEWSVEVSGLTEGTTYMYYAYAKVGDEVIKGATKTFTTKTDSDADISIDFSDASIYPSGFPTSKGTSALETYLFDGRYNIAIYAPDAYYRLSSGDCVCLFMGKKGAYLVLPALEGKSLVRVVAKASPNVAADVEIGISDMNDVVVDGGAVQAWQKDGTCTYELKGTTVNTAYKLFVDNDKNVQISALDLYYMDGEAISLTPSTSELTFEPDETTEKTQVYTWTGISDGRLQVSIAPEDFFTAELDADGKTVKVAPKSANDSDSPRTATVTVTLTDKADATRTATATIAVTQASATPQPISSVIAGGTGKDVFVEGEIVAKHMQGFVLNDGTGMLYIYVKSAPAQNVGDKVQVKGKTNIYNNFFRIENPVVTPVEAGGSYTQPTLEQMTASEIDAYVAETSLPVKYVQYKGTLTHSGQYYNVIIDGTAVQGSIQNPPAELIDAALVGAPIVVTGYSVGKSTSGSTTYFNTMATSVEADSSAPATITSVDPGSLSWANDKTDAQTVTVTGANLNGITWTLSGAESSHFTVSEGASSTTGAITTIVLTITPTGANTGVDAITETLTIQATGGNSQEITLTHNGSATDVELYTTGFEDTDKSGTSNSYTGSHTYTETESGVKWNMTYADIVSTGTPISGTFNITARVAKNTSNSPVIYSDNLLSKEATRISKVTFKSQGDTVHTLKVEYSTNGTDWIASDFNQTLTGTATDYTANINLETPTSTFMLRFTISVSATVSANKDAKIDDIVVYGRW